MVADTTQPVDGIELLSAEERASVLQASNGPSLLPIEGCVHQLFEAQAAAFPDAIALVQGNVSLRYAELDARANGLARRLLAQGADPDRPIAICCERRPYMIVALLAVMKAGCAYLPLDPAYPVARLAEIIDDAQPRLLLADTAGRRAFGGATPRADLAFIDLEGRVDGATEIAHAEQRRPEVASAGAAYVIYTSGSTGKPKGVVVEHRALMARVTSMIHRYGLRREDRALQFASFTFDVSLEEIFPTLAVGATLVLHDPQGHGDTATIWRQCNEERITILNLPTRFFEAACVDSRSELPATLRLVIIGGEAARDTTLAAWFAIARTSCQLLNAYGPTEAVVTATAHDPVMASDFSNIGRPLGNTRLYLLDERRQPVPPGAPGEIYLGGPCLARGYLNAPEATAERFVDDPFTHEPAARMYRTGDIGRMRADGTLEFVGRVDGQIKIRGFRVELGEIESRLVAHPSVREAVVIVREEGLGQRLVAYVTSDQALDPAALRQQLASQLPHYMVPSAYVQLEALPLTVAGKLDRKALPAPEIGGTALDVELPAGPVEAELAAIWSEVLGIERIGRHEHFFELGGHSLLAMRVISRVRRIHPDLPLKAIFEHPTIAELALVLSDGAGRDARPVITIPKADDDAAHELSMAQQRLWFLHQLEPGSSAYNMTHAVRMRGRVDVGALRRSFAQLVARHDTLRTRFHGDDRGRLEVLPERAVPFHFIDLSGLPAVERELQLCIDAESERPFDLASEPLLRVTLITLGPDEHVLLTNMHHIVSDGWSVAVMIREVCRYYEDDVKGLQTSSPPLRVQYGDYAAWQRQRLSGDRLERLEHYWRSQLVGPLPMLALPQEAIGPEAITMLGEQFTTTLEATALARLRACAREQNASLFMQLVGACGLLFQRITTQEDVIVGTPIAGRTEPETEALIGCFLNVLALRLDLTGEPTFRELLERVKAVCVGAFEHQELPFEKLIELIQPERRLARNPIFDVLLNVVNLPSSVVALDGLTISDMEMESPQAKFGLTIYAEEKAGALELRFVWQRDRFSRGQMHAMAHQLVHLLRQVAAAPDEKISWYSLVTDHDRPQLPAPHVPLGVEGVRIETVPALFRGSVERFPDAPAIRYRGRTYGYLELSRSAAVLSADLRREDGLAPGDRVAITGPRSFGLMTAILAVLQAGGVLVLLDKKLSVRRRQEILVESGARHLIVVGSTLDVADAAAGRTVRLVHPVEPLAGDAVAAPAVDPDAPAYVFFTSGTTGKPKGIVGQHKALAHFVTWQRETYQIGPGDRSAQLTGLGFDVVMRDTLTPLTSGATLCLLDQEEDLSAETLFAWFARERITMMHLVPTLAKAWLMDERHLARLPSLRQVFFAGEFLPAAVVRAWRKAVSDQARIVNLYGPTETTLAKAHYVVPSDEPLPSTMPVGRPMTATELLVLNAEKQPCGIGEPGEVVVRTRFPSLGYLHAGRAAPQFIVNPFRDDDSDLLYFTGDLGYIRHDGVVCLTGRRDDQVKIRGMRVELGEIHAALVAHPGVREGVIVSYDDEQGDKRVAAYYVAVNRGLDAASLQAFSKERLPDYMIPFVWIEIDALPMTANGKLDRLRLPDPRTAEPLVNRQAYVAPTSTLETQVAAVWRRALGREEIGVHDNFFDLGGHSLLLLQVKTQLQAELQRELPVVALFQHPTVSSLAKYLASDPAAPALAIAAVTERVNLRRAALEARRKR
jgi:amino acid adenylation domain-containing protein